MSNAFAAPETQAQPTHRRSARPTPGVAGLYARLTALRAELEQRSQHHRLIIERFRRDIRPLEVQLAARVTALSRALIDHYRARALDEASQILLGLWVEENLKTLDGHPFIDADPVKALCAQWRQVLSETDSATDRQLSLMRAGSENDARTRRSMPGNSVPGREQPAEDDVSERTQGHSSRRGGGAQHDGRVSHRDAGQEGARTGTRDNATGSTGAHSSRNRNERQDSSHPPGNRTSAAHNAAEDPAIDIINLLFRRLARQLHPDRETDASLKAHKDALMKNCLLARQDKDLGALMALCEAHLGPVDAILGPLKDSTVTAQLQNEINNLEARLLRLQQSDPFNAMIFHRYDDTSQSAVAARFNAHQQSLHSEIATCDASLDATRTTDGLSGLLEKRRSLAFDRLTIAELTGLS